MKSKVFLFVLLSLLISGCATHKPVVIEKESLCVYGKRVKGIAEVLSKRVMSDGKEQYHCRFYPGDGEFKTSEITLKKRVPIGAELMAVRLSLVSGPSKCSQFDYQLTADSEYE